eukprot:766973-Hanusia_phi.AAC.5
MILLSSVVLALDLGPLLLGATGSSQLLPHPSSSPRCYALVSLCPPPHLCTSSPSPGTYLGISVELPAVKSFGAKSSAPRWDGTDERRGCEGRADGWRGDREMEEKKLYRQMKQIVMSKKSCRQAKGDRS